MPSYLISALTVACALFMENLDSTVIATSLPAIARDLHEDPISLKLALTSYLVSLAIFIPASGWAADRFGARKIFRMALLVFTLGSILCGTAITLPGFVGARVIQGAGFSGSMCRSASSAWFLATVFVKDVAGEATWPLDVRGFLLCGLGLACLLFRLGGAGRGLMPWEAAVFLAGLGGLALTAHVLHARRAAFPLLDLKLLSIKTFRASVMGGSLFRIGIGSIPFLLPLMLQAGFGMTAFQSGSVTFIASVGAMAMKATAAPILRMFGFRRVLVYDAILSAAFLGCYGFFTPATPILLMMSMLLVGGFVRSLEFTSLNAIVFAEIEPARMSRAVSFSSAAQQLSLSVGIAAGAGALQGFRKFRMGFCYNGNYFFERRRRISAPATGCGLGPHREPARAIRGHRPGGAMNSFG